MKRLSLIAAALVLATLVAAPAFACMQPTCEWWNPFCEEDLDQSSIVTFIGPDRALVSFTGYKTTDVEPNNSCIVALPPVDGVVAVRSVVNYDSDSGEPLGWVDFGAAKVPGREIALLAEDLGLASGDQPWHGFLTQVTADVDAGAPNHFVIEVALDPDVSPWEFIQALRADGIWATSSSDSVGNPTPDHNHFVRVSDTELIVVFPPR